MDEQSIFLTAIEKETLEARAQWLAEACGTDHALKARIEALIERHHESSSFLEQVPAEFEATIIPNSSNQDRARALQAGLAAAFQQDESVVIGNAGHSVLKSLGQSIDIPRVALRESKTEGRDPIVRPKSAEMPQRDSDSRYRLDGEIARGGMGAILKGRDTDLGRDVAIKVLLDQHKDKPEVIQRFVEEAQIGGQLQHPGIAPIYELGQFADTRPFFAMKLVKGETLSKLLGDREDAATDRGKFIGIFEQICQTMAYAHSRGVIHRDLKPANIMVGAFGEVQVMDWGLAKVLQVGGVADEKKAYDKLKDHSIIQTLRSQPGSDVVGTFGTVGSHTQMGSVMGTPAYMPPEQALGEIDNLDERADVFGLGAILCEILTGKPPYVADDGTRVFRMASRGKLDGAFERLDQSGADADLITLTRDCLHLEPADRPRNAGVLAARVTEYLESVETRLHATETAHAVQAERLEQQHHSARKLRKMLAGLAAVAVIAVGTSLVAGKFWLEADVSRRSAEQSEVTAKREATRATEQRLLAENNLVKADQAEKEARAQRDAAQQAQRDALDQTYLATFSEIRAMRLARQSGWRTAALDRLSNLVKMGSRNLDLVDLRSEAFACLAEMDVRIQSTLNAKFHAWHMQYSPDGQTVAVNTDLSISLQDLNTKRELRSIPKPFTWAPFAFHPNGTLAAATRQGAVTFYPLMDGQPEFPEIVGDGHAMNFGFSHSGDRVVIAWADVSGDEGHPKTPRRGIVYATATGAVLWGFDFPPNIPVDHKFALAMSPDGLSVATVGPSNEVRLYTEEAHEAPSVLGKFDDRICSIEFHPDGQSLLVAGRLSGAVWNLATRSEMYRIHAPEGGFWDAAFSPDGQLLGGVADDGIVRLWDSRSGRELAAVPTETGHFCLSLTFSPQGDCFAVGGETVTVFQIEGRRACRFEQGTVKGVSGVVFDGIQAALYSSGRDGRIWKWMLDEPAAQVHRLLAYQEGNPVVTRLAPDGRHLAQSYTHWSNRQAGDFSISVWPVIAPDTERRLQGPKQPVRDIAFDPAGLSLAATSEDGGVYIWDFESGVLQNRIDLPGTHAIQYLDDRTLVVAVMNRLVLIAADDGTIRGEVALPTLIDAMVLTPDRQAALTMSSGGVLHRIHLPDLATRQSQLQLDDLLGFRLEISPDGRLLAVMYGSECMLVDPQSLQPLAQLPAYDKKLTCLAFDKDTRYFAVGGAQIALWDLAIIRGELIRLGLDFSELETEDAVAVFAASMRETQGRAAKAKIIATAAALPGVLEELSQKATDDGQFQAELGRHHMEQGSVALANTAYSKARILFERQLVKEPQNSEVAGELAQVLLEVQDHSIVTHLTARTLHQMQIGDPWARLATAYHCADDQAAFEQLIAQHPTAASGVGDL